MININKQAQKKAQEWIELKFEQETPTCRTLHQQLTIKERMYIYGGTDI